MVHVPKDQADDVNMDDDDDNDDDDDGGDDDDDVDDDDVDDDDVDDDDVQEEVELLPTLQVIVGPQESSKKEEDVSSQERGNIPTSRTLWRDRDTWVEYIESW